MPPERRDAFTLIELLVVIVVVVMLLGILLPAVQATRVAAQKTLCTSRFRQIGTAIHNYESVSRQFPPSKTQSKDRRVPEHNVITFLLPFLEQQHIYDRFDFRRHWSLPPNPEAASVRLPEILCPLAEPDRVLETDNGYFRYPSDYAACEQFFVRNDLIEAGIIRQRSSWWSILLPSFEGVSTIASVTDGLTNSMMLFECAGRPRHYKSGRIRASAFESPGEPISGTGWADVDANFWIHRTCGPDQRQFLNCSNNNELFSFHPEGAPFLYGDGTVRFHPESIDPDAFVSFFTGCADDAIPALP
ncbi:MAG TPA: hypothetical protein DEB39_08010 [Planctomycetaceae bacterium]|nr:hypothetical protein [Planctomycetaceae bacterium]